MDGRFRASDNECTLYEGAAEMGDPWCRSNGLICVD